MTELESSSGVIDQTKIDLVEIDLGKIVNRVKEIAESLVDPTRGGMDDLYTRLNVAINEACRPEYGLVEYIALAVANALNIKGADFQYSIVSYSTTIDCSVYRLDADCGPFVWPVGRPLLGDDSMPATGGLFEVTTGDTDMDLVVRHLGYQRKILTCQFNFDTYGCDQISVEFTVTS